MNPCVLFSGIPHDGSFRRYTESIPQVYGIHSAGIRNPFRRYTESIPQVYGILATYKKPFYQLECVSPTAREHPVGRDELLPFVSHDV